jgi:FkbM family methyltransferase
VRVTQAAVAAESGTAIFDDNGAGSGTNGLVSGDHRLTAAQHNEQVGRTVEVQTYGLDDIVAEYGGTIDVMKIDCEGAEYDLVYNSKRENWSTVQRLVLEYHQVEGQSWDELRSWFGEVGLSVVRHEPVTAGLGTAWLSREPLPPEH